MDDLKKAAKLSKLGRWALAQGWELAWDNMVVLSYSSSKLSSKVYVSTLKLCTVTL